MTSEDCCLDIHICGACRSEFSDIFKFIQHKRECYLSATRSQGQISKLAHLAGQFGHHLPSAVGLQLDLLGTEFHHETYPGSAAQSGGNSESPDTSSVQISVSSVLPTSVYSMPDCTVKDSSHFTHSLKTVFEPKTLDVAAAYSYSWPADSDIQDDTVSANVGNNITESELSLVTEVVPYSRKSMTAENVEDESRSHVEISADNIAVYVMSPKSFASSVRTEQKGVHDAGNKSLSDFSTGSLWNDTHSHAVPCTHMPDVLNGAATCASGNPQMNFHGDEQQNDLMFIYQDNAASSILKSGTTSVFYNDSQLKFASNNSTPCPEDLEVGQISAAMFGKKNRHEDLKFVNVSTEQAMTTAAESVQDAGNTSFLDATSVVSQAETYKMLNGDMESIQDYIRENTASAPITKAKRESGDNGKRRVSVEKRERLQGVSDDLLSSLVRVTPLCGSHGQSMGLHQQLTSQTSNGNTAIARLPHKTPELPPVTNPCLVSGYKAVFTSPSSGGHRLTPTHADLSDSFNCSLQDISSLKKQFFAKASSGFVSKSIEYKNISALMQIPSRQSHTELPRTVPGKRSEAEVPFTTLGKEPQKDLPQATLGKQPPASLPQTSLEKQPPAYLPQTSLGKKPPADLPQTSLGKKPQADLPQTSLGKQPQAFLPQASLGKQPQADLPQTSLGKQPQAFMSQTSLGTKPQADLPQIILGEMPQADLPQTSLREKPQADLAHNTSDILTQEQKEERWIHFEIIGSRQSKNSEKLRFISDKNVVLPEIPTNQTVVTHNSIKTLNKNIASAAISSLDTPTLSSLKKAVTSASEEVKAIEINANGRVQLSVNRGSIHHVKENAPVAAVNNWHEIQMCTEEISSIDPQVMTSTDKNREILLMPQNEDYYEHFLTSCVNNSPSIVMIYRNVDGSVIMMPKMLYSTTPQKSSNIGINTSNTDLSLCKELINDKKSHSAQQATELETSFSAIDTPKSSSQCFYLHTASIESQPTETSDVGDYVTLTDSAGFAVCNQAKSIVPTSGNIQSHTQRNKMPEKSPDYGSALNGPVIAEKEKFIIKPKLGEGSSKSQAAALAQSNKNGKRNSQISQMKDVQVCEVTEQAQNKSSRTFTCQFDKCRYTTSLHKDFQRHYRSHTGEKPYHCPDCGKAFNRSDKLKIHQRRHTGLKPFQCQMCDYAAIEGGSLKKHMRIHTDERPFKCQICSYASRNSSQLTVHLRTHTGDSPFHCTKCPAKFKINSDLKRHSRIHTGEKPFQCDKCDYKSSNKGNLTTHIKTNHLEANEIHCPTCQFVTSSQKRFKEHERVHNGLVVKCTQCEYTCANFGQLRSHAIVHNSVKPFRCKFCSYSSRQSGNLKKHIQNMHLHKLRARSKNATVEMVGPVKLPGTRRENVLLPVSERSSVHKRRSTAGCRKMHSCQECGSSFVREDSLRCHMKQHSTHLGESTVDKEEDEQPKSDHTDVGFQCDHATTTPSSTFYGIQQIVAAASKIYEENYGDIEATNHLPLARTKSFQSLDSLSGHSVDQLFQQSQGLASSHFRTSSSTDTTLIKKRRMTSSPQLPWEGGSYTESVCSLHNSHTPSSPDHKTASFPSHTKTQTGNVSDASCQQFQSKIDQNNLIFTRNKSIHPSSQLDGKQQNLDLTKVRKIEKSFLSPLELSSPSELEPLSQLQPKADYIRSQTAASPKRPGAVSMQSLVSSASLETGPTVFLTCQEASMGTMDPLQGAPQYQLPQSAPASTQGGQPIHPMSVNTTQVQLQPAAQIQIVMPGTSTSKPGQLVKPRGASVLPQQILLQVQGISEGSHVFTIPVASLDSLQTTGQILSHHINHFTLQQNGLINSKVCRTTESQPADAQNLDQPAFLLRESIQNIASSHLASLPESAQEVIRKVKEDSQIILCSQGQLI